MSQFVCEECREEISPEASTCPHCGYEPSRSEELKAALILATGAVLCLTIIGLPIGLYLGYKGHQKRQQSSSLRPAVKQ